MTTGRSVLARPTRVIPLVVFVPLAAAFLLLEVAGPNPSRMWSGVTGPNHRTVLRGENRTFSVLGFERWVESRTVLVFVRNGTQ